MIRSGLFVLAAYYGLLGVLILLFPQGFYDLTPGVSMMGPYNAHFVRDLALIFMACALSLVFGAGARSRPVAVSASLWPFFHALFHFWIWIARGLPVDHVAVSDAVGVIIPGLAVFFLALKLKENCS